MIKKLWERRAPRGRIILAILAVLWIVICRSSDWAYWENYMSLPCEAIFVVPLMLLVSQAVFPTLLGWLALLTYFVGFSLWDTLVASPEHVELVGAHMSLEDQYAGGIFITVVGGAIFLALWPPARRTDSAAQ